MISDKRSRHMRKFLKQDATQFFASALAYALAGDARLAEDDLRNARYFARAALAPVADRLTAQFERFEVLP